MTRVCLIGADDYTLQYELLSRETAREALSTYDLRRPFENTIALRTVSVGAAISLLNDLDWYLTRFVDEALVQEPSVSDEEWLSRELATQLRNSAVGPDETDEFCKIYGVERVGPDASATPAAGADTEHESEHELEGTGSGESDEKQGGGAQSAGGTQAQRGTQQTETETETATATARRRLVEPLYVRRTDGELPEYDLRDVDSTLVVRITETEHSP
ncbi:hypothetical protein C483_16236 [Natrialba hulunbeirensis JCM 10989]|uniref:Uncharacterized protein n=1 Tax=Natrialba hulunbeirensis JCM 10989 TaxID=1227493 RepID=L9ZQB6_9EURY|nr:DUF5804 family protein [Natrialba hulunbeirensis]ELY88276.1 hypothetical protein C483_16236 [Natrialba hulunbeirensis JCM 10989]